MSTLTDFQKVCDFNECFDFPNHDDFSDLKCLQLRLDLIEEEILELKDAINKNDIVEEQDACSDILYVLYGMAYTYNFDSDIFMNSNYEYKNNIDKNVFTTLFNKLNFDLNTSREILLNNITHTFDDLVKNANNQNINSSMICLHNLIFYIYHFQLISGYDSDRNFSIVHDSNMSKLCKSEEEAEQTVIKYFTDYQNGTSPYDSPYYYKLENDLYVVKNKSTGKALKSINYIKVKF